MRVSDMTREDRQERLAWIEGVRNPSHAYRREAGYLKLVESLEEALKDAIRIAHIALIPENDPFAKGAQRLVLACLSNDGTPECEAPALYRYVSEKEGL